MSVTNCGTLIQETQEVLVNAVSKQDLSIGLAEKGCCCWQGIVVVLKRDLFLSLMVKL